jgi:hypothetical protein
MEFAYRFIKREFVCVICKKTACGYSNSPYPVKQRGGCCDECNMKYVTKARVDRLMGGING